MDEDDAVSDCRVRQRLCLARFLDENRAIFRAPSTSAAWEALIQSNVELHEEDQQVWNRAMDMLRSVFRDAQASMMASQREAFEPASVRADEAAMGSVEPDPMALALGQADGDDAGDDAEFARAVTLFKRALREGQVTTSQFFAAADSLFGGIGGSAPFAQSLVQTAADMVRIQMSALLGDELAQEAV